MKLDSWTVRFRFLAWALFSLTVLVALAGWVLVDRDPTKLDGLLLWTTAAAGIGEAGNIGKRATFSKDAHAALSGKADE